MSLITSHNLLKQSNILGKHEKKCLACKSEDQKIKDLASLIVQAKTVEKNLEKYVPRKKHRVGEAGEALLDDEFKDHFEVYCETNGISDTEWKRANEIAACCFKK